MKKLFDIYHRYDVDNGYGDATSVDEKVATVFETQEAIDEFVKKWNKPRVYKTSYDKLYEHEVYARESSVKDLKDVIPYEGERW